MSLDEKARDEQRTLNDRSEILRRLGEIEVKLDRLMPLADLLALAGDGKTSPLKLLAALRGS